jgi:GAF domain-containing protein
LSRPERGQTIAPISDARVAGQPADHHLQLLQTFADQAVIAIQNAAVQRDERRPEQQTDAGIEVISGRPAS